jgi:acyl-homoserine-lactone acylase
MNTHRPQRLLLRRSLAAVAVASAICAVSVPVLGERDLAALLGPHALIRRDTFGIPHITADSEEAAAFAFGYAQAEDHAPEIARRYVNARGDAARVFGRAALENDLVMRRMDNLGEARRALDKISGLYRKLIRGFVAGINTYVTEHRAELPDWIPPFTEADVLAYSRASAAEAVVSASLIRALTAKYGAGPSTGGKAVSSLGSGPKTTSPADDAEAAEAPGSNALALAGSRTVSGSPILLGNPHLAWSSLYWEAHVTVRGRINFFGSTLAGIPVLRAGFNDRLGFVTTNNAPDLDDIFALPLDQTAADRYLFEGRSRALTRKDVAIEVRNEDGSMATERRSYWSSHLGPIVYRTPALAFAMKSTRFDAWRYFEGFYRLSRTSNLGAFLDVMRQNLVPTSNFTYADGDGNILYQWNGRVPRRVDAGTDYTLDVPGATGKYVWKKLHKLDDLPRLLNPSGGSIQNANNPPWFTSLTDPLDAAKYPGYFERGPLGLRPQLALDLLARQQRFSPEDVVRLKFSTRMLLAERVKPDLLAALRALQTPSEDARRALQLLGQWDNQVAADSRGALVFQRFWDTYSAAVRQPYARPWNTAEQAVTPAGLADTGAAVRHVEEAIRWVRQSYGKDDAAWGEVNRFRFNGVDLPGDGASGSYGCYRVVTYAPAPDRKRAAGWVSDAQPLTGFGDGWVLLVHFTKPVAAWSVLAYGQTTEGDSPHSRDQIGIFAAHQLRPVWFSEADIRAHTERSYRPGGPRQ